MANAAGFLNTSGSPAYKEIDIINETSTITGLPTNGSKVLYIVTIRNGTAYTIDYIDSSDKFSKHLPEIQRIINSFEFTK